MAKSTRKKNQKNADFKKAKLKLGKGKQPASNATDTSFKARSVALPKQSVNIIKAGSTPTTRRNLTLDELLSQMKHYSASVRKDAISGLKELLSENQELIEPSLAVLINRSVTLISDEDAMVRKLLLSFLSWILHRVPIDTLAPHVPVLVLFSISALSHIFPEIRVDAVRFIDILLDICPEATTGNWTNSDTVSLADRGGETSASGASSSVRWILEGYLALLDIKSSTGENAVGATSTLVLSSNSKLTVMKSFSRFLHVSLARGSSMADSSASAAGASPTWFFQDLFISPVAFRAFTSSLTPSSPEARLQWQASAENAGFDEDFLGHSPLANLDDTNALSSWSLKDLGSAGAKIGPSGRDRHPAIMELADRVAPLLVSTFLDCAPSVFLPSTARAPSNLNVNLELIATVGNIARTLYSAVVPRAHDTDDVGSNAVDNLRLLLGYMAVYFPFDAEPVFKRDLQSDQLLHELGLAYCELTALLALATQNKNIPTKVKRAGGNRDFKLNDEMERVGGYIIHTLQGQVATASQPLGRRLSGQAYVSLLPTIWSLLNSRRNASSSVDDAAIASRVFDAVLQHAIQASPSVKPIATDFVAHLYLIHVDAACRDIYGLKNGGGPSRLVEWLLTVPRLLWELGTQDLHFTERLILFLLRVFQRRKNLMNMQNRAELRRRLCPYFNVRHATKGVVQGPYHKLPSELRRRFLDVVWISTPEGNVDELEEKITGSVTGNEEEDYWRHLRLRARVV